jgi:hypothetical protein
MVRLIVPGISSDPFSLPIRQKHGFDLPNARLMVRSIVQSLHTGFCAKILARLDRSRSRRKVRFIVLLSLRHASSCRNLHN